MKKEFIYNVIAYNIKNISFLFERRLYYTLLIFYSLLNQNCNETPKIAPSSYLFIKPTYNNIQLVSQGDTLHFPLSENTYNEIKSFNHFENKGAAYISFYDRRSESVNIYKLTDQKRIAKLKLKKIFKKKPLYKTSVFVKNFDSIFIANLWTLYLVDSSGTIKKSIDYYKRSDAMALLGNNVPLAAKNDSVFMGVRPYVKETSLSSIKKWRILYGFDLDRMTKKLYYPLPEIYYSNLFDDRFFDYSYCLNNKGNFVISFPADSNIYETNLSSLHKAYFGKSKFQNSPIQSISKESLEKDNGYKEYFARDSYGPIYFDPSKKMYLRIAKRGIADKLSADSIRNRYSVIFFNENFKIIGESELRSAFYLNTLFITSNGNIYARVNASDEYVLHYIRLEYKGEQNEQMEITKK